MVISTSVMVMSGAGSANIGSFIAESSNRLSSLLSPIMWLGLESGVVQSDVSTSEP